MTAPDYGICQNCGAPAQLDPGQIMATHRNGFVYCSLLDWTDTRTAVMPEAPEAGPHD